MPPLWLQLKWSAYLPCISISLWVNTSLLAEPTGTVESSPNLPFISSFLCPLPFPVSTTLPFLWSPGTPSFFSAKPLGVPFLPL